MPAHLINPANKERKELCGNTLIGRSADAQVRLVDNRISRQHAMIRVQGDDEYWFYDLGSINGSLINERRVVAGQLLKVGDVIRILDHAFEFESTSTSVADTGERDSFASTQPMLRSLPVVILVSDVRGYTTLSERLPAAKLAQIIGGWYRECTRIIEGNGGIVDKFIGDAVLAYWTSDAPASRASAARVPAALSAACDKLAAEHAESLAGTVFGCGYALHLGPVILGHIGTGAYTLVGDTVNVTFRLQSLTRTLNQTCLVTGEFIKDWPEVAAHCQNLGAHSVKGHAGPIDVYGLNFAGCAMI
jgi:adenylate cyclase